MAMRNFWIEADVDGRKTRLMGGPRSKDGGFKLTVYMRDDGDSVIAAHVRGTEVDGRLFLSAYPDSDVTSEHTESRLEDAGDVPGFGVATNR
jgi:hypothetical protein